MQKHLKSISLTVSVYTDIVISGAQNKLKQISMQEYQKPISLTVSPPAHPSIKIGDAQNELPFIVSVPPSFCTDIGKNILK